MKQILLITFIFVFNLVAFGQNRSFEELSFDVSVLKSNVISLEPLSLRMILQNHTDKPVTVDTSLNFITPAVSLEIKQPNGKTVVPPRLYHMNGRSYVMPYDIAPGANFESRQFFGFQLFQYMNQIGEYQLRASFKNNEGKTISSNWISVTVGQPNGTDLNAYQYIMGKVNSTARDLRSSPFYEWPQEELESFMIKFPETTYASYVRYSLGDLYFEKEKERSAQQYRMLADDPSFIFAKEVESRLKVLESQLKRKN